MSRGLGQFLLFCSHCINIAHLLQVSRLCCGALWLHFLRAYIGPPQKAKDCMKVKVKALIILFAVISIWQKAKEWIFGLLKGKWSKLFFFWFSSIFLNEIKFPRFFWQSILEVVKYFRWGLFGCRKHGEVWRKRKRTKTRKRVGGRRPLAREWSGKDLSEFPHLVLFGEELVLFPLFPPVPTYRTCTVRLSLSHREILQESWGSSWITQGKGKRSVKH